MNSIIINAVEDPSILNNVFPILDEFVKRQLSLTILRASTDAVPIYETAPAASHLNQVDVEPKTFACSEFMDDEGNYYMQVTGQFMSGDKSMTLDIASDITTIYNIRQRQYDFYGILFLIMIPLGAIISGTFSFLLTKPLRRLSLASRKVTQGHLSSRIDIYSDDEIGEVSRDINSMTDMLEENIMELDETVACQERFIAIFTHEIKTPMTSVIGYADLLRDGTLNQVEQMDDCNVRITFDKTRCSACKKESSAQRLKKAGFVELRFVRIVRYRILGP